MDNMTDKQNKTIFAICMSKNIPMIDTNGWTNQEANLWIKEHGDANYVKRESTPTYISGDSTNKKLDRIIELLETLIKARFPLADLD